MDVKLILAIITITLALIFYTIGVFSERKAHVLRKPHVIIFWLGLVFDTTGTTIMSTIAESKPVTGGINLHGITGALAIALMLFHAVWATIVLVKRMSRNRRISTNSVFLSGRYGWCLMCWV